MASHGRMPQLSLLLLLLGAAAGPSELTAKCGSVGGCPDAQESPDESLHLLQQHAMHRTLPVERQTKAAAKAHSNGMLSVPAPVVKANSSKTHQSMISASSPAVGRSRASDVTTTTELDTEADPLGLSTNSAGDLNAFFSAAVTNIATMVFCVGVFMVMRVRYPLMYSGNVVREGKTAPSRPDPKAWFSWYRASMDADFEDWFAHVGLDNTMLLEFTHLAMRLCTVIGVPMLCILAPMHCLFGGYAAGDDHMSYLSVGNVRYNSWLYFVHPFVVWAVVVTVVTYIFQAQKKFVQWRFQWLKHLPEKCANTVLVSGISRKCQSDGELRDFFEKLFPGVDRIKSAYIAKDTSKLTGLVSQWTYEKRLLTEAQQHKKETGHPVLVRDRSTSLYGELVEAEGYYTELLSALWKEIDATRSEIIEASKKVGEDSFNSSHGFVTFTTRADAELALRLDAISKDQNKWSVERPPEPNDIIWSELTEDSTEELGRTFMGYVLLAGLFVAYVPIIVALTHVAKAVNLGPLQSLWEGLAPTFGLQFMIAFLPTFIILIFRLFFALKAEAYCQHRLQICYFWFQVFFVIMATAVGKHVTQFITALVESPLAIFGFMGQTMPEATHFYLNFMVLQWVAHSMNMMRYVPLTKYKTFCALYYSEEEAADFSEPEDQDYYGVGSRSARWTINLVICIVFGTLSPPIFLLTFLNFFISRVCYGYLIPFAETKKSDTGGFMWVTMLRHLFIGLMIYVILMTGVLYERASSSIASWITATALVYVIWALNRFDTHFSWEKLPFKYVLRGDGCVPKGEISGQYDQPELFATYEEIKAFSQEQGWKGAEKSTST